MPQPSDDLRQSILNASPAALQAVRRQFDPGVWATDTARISLPKGPFSFEGREFIRPVYKDLSEEIVVIKGAQMGFSTMSIIRALWAVTTFPLSVIYCVDETTELLSQRGWLKWDQVRVGEPILTFDRDTNTTRWSPVDEVFVERNYVGPMVHMQNRQFDAFVTPNHRWLAKPLHGTQWHFYETDSLPDHQMLPLIAPHGDFPSGSPYSDDFVELAAWTITEGHYRHSYPTETVVVLTQNAGAKADKIRGLLDRVGAMSRRGREGPFEQWDGRRFSWYFDGPPATMLRAALPSKELTPEFVLSLTRPQLEILVTTMLDGDGDRSGREMFHQKSKATVDAFAMACMLLGRAVSVRRRDRDGFQWYEVRLRRGAWAKSQRIRRTTVQYTGLVWCPRTRDGTFFMRRGPSGPVLLTGNTFPTKGDVSTFTAARINPIIATSPYLADRIQNFDSVGMKQFARIPREEQKRHAALGNPVSFSTIYFNGAQNPKDATSVDADLLIHDEEDRSDHRTIEEYQSRLYASRFKWMIRLSTPTIPGAGIDRQWKRSDMQHWLIRCQSCNAEFEMDFPQNIEPSHFTETPEGGKVNGTPARYKCHRCNATLAEEARLRGRWVAERPNIAVHGYYINQMSASWVPAIKILEQEFKATHKGAFWNLVMARPFQEGTNAMTKEAILARQKETVVGAGVPKPRQEDGARGLACTMGIDVGKFIDVVIGTTDMGRPRTIEFKRLSGEAKWDELDELMIRYGVVSAVIDADPEEHLSRVFCRKWEGRAWRCRWSHGKVRDIKWDEETRLVTAPRTETLTRSSVELLTERILPIYDESEWYNAYISHHENSKKVPIFRNIEGDGESSGGDDTVDRERIVDHYEWRETGPDHMFLAGTYEMLARMGYQGNAGLPSVALVTLDRSKSHHTNSEKAERKAIKTGLAGTLPMLLPTSMRRAKRRTF